MIRAMESGAWGSLLHDLLYRSFVSGFAAAFRACKKRHPKIWDARKVLRTDFAVTPMEAFPSSPLPSWAGERVSAADAEEEAPAWRLPAEACAVVRVRSEEA